MAERKAPKRPRKSAEPPPKPEPVKVELEQESHSKTVRLSRELLEYLAQFAEPLVDTPNTVIEMIVGIRPRSPWFREHWR